MVWKLIECERQMQGLNWKWMKEKAVVLVEVVLVWVYLRKWIRSNRPSILEDEISKVRRQPPPINDRSESSASDTRGDWEGYRPSAELGPTSEAVCCSKVVKRSFSSKMVRRDAFNRDSVFWNLAFNSLVTLVNRFWPFFQEWIACWVPSKTWVNKSEYVSYLYGTKTKNISNTRSQPSENRARILHAFSG